MTEQVIQAIFIAVISVGFLIYAILNKKDEE